MTPAPGLTGHARSYLFVPGNRPDRFDKACSAGAGAVIIDLEDAVAPADKALARATVHDWLSADKPVLVRINAVDTEWFADDLALCSLPGVAGIVLPKSEHAEHVRLVTGAGAAAVLPLIESAVGFAQMAAITQETGVRRLVFGSIDFQLDLGIEGDDDALLFFRSHLVLQSKLAALLAPVDGVTVGIDDVVQLCADAQRARRLGFGAKLCIHPKQVEHVNRAFRPDIAMTEWAARVVAASNAANGAAVSVDGKMVDLPILLKARRILAEPS